MRAALFYRVNLIIVTIFIMRIINLCKFKKGDEIMDIKQLTQLAVKYLTDSSQHKVTTNGSFKVLMTVTVDNVKKPLLLIGSVTSEMNGGNCVAILNPEKSLVDWEELRSTDYTEHFKETFAKRCDMAVNVFLNIWMQDYVNVAGTYTSKVHTPAKFYVR